MYSRLGIDSGCNIWPPALWPLCKNLHDIVIALENLRDPVTALENLRDLVTALEKPPWTCDLIVTPVAAASMESMVVTTPCEWTTATGTGWEWRNVLYSNQRLEQHKQKRDVLMILVLLSPSEHCIHRLLASLPLLYVGLCTVRWRSGTLFYHDTSTNKSAGDREYVASWFAHSFTYPIKACLVSNQTTPY